MARLRKAKLRAERIEAGYYRRSHPFRRWRLWLSLLALAASGAWAVALFRGPDLAAVSPGRMSTAHAMLADRCTACHMDGAQLAKAAEVIPDGAARAADHTTSAARPAAPRWRGATDAACRSCHDVPDHHENAIGTPHCADCHVEHRGLPALAEVRTARCTACHAELTAHLRGEPTIVRAEARAIRSFQERHPEFAVWTGSHEAPQRAALDAASPPRDLAHLKLNHRLHLKADLPGPPGKPRVTLQCTDCHQGPLLAVTTPYGRQPPGWTPATSPELAPAEQPAYMAPVRYAQHCAFCHPNNFSDPRFPEPAPHAEPRLVHAYLRGVYADWIAAHPDELQGPPRGRPIGEGATARSAPTADAWVAERVAAAEAVLFDDPKRCRFCHDLEVRPDALPVVAPTRVPVRWFPLGRFDHGVHRLLTCGECHAARESKDTGDVLLPRRAVCASCHHPSGARDACAECHTYHAAVAQPAMDGRLRIAPLAGRE